MATISRRITIIAACAALAGTALVGCTTTKPEAKGSPRSERAALETESNAALSRLYETAPGSRELVARAPGVLIFPAVVGGSFVIGVEHGRGVLRVNGKTDGYYSTTGASIGWQAGGQSKAVIYVFSTMGALEKFKSSNGWSVGADATVTAGKVGANGNIDTTTAQAPVSSFVITNVGLEAGVSLQGAKISKVDL